MSWLRNAHRQLEHAPRREPLWATATVFARLTLSSGFLSAVADRLGLWGPAHTGSVTWGDFESFIAYTQKLAPYLPDGLVDVTAWAVTVAELVVGLTLLAGVAVRWSAWAATGLLLVFALSMGVFVSWEAPLNASVFAACAAAALLGLSPVRTFAFSLDRLSIGRREAQQIESR
ncbi:MauE/DoxX family redox-associated membrane protein [Saccharopolyspora sp. 5N708]|uniref:MauE/DoxX family redox-associated membrane protein n=1 Tax=Saccharopolyspora sp. 5N708 TaxID=3457424 RepID=UPI003FD50241